MVLISGPAPVTVTVEQVGADPLLSVAPALRNVAAVLGSTTFDVSSNGTWFAESDAAWCTVTPTFTGSGTLTADFTENISILPRTASITVMVSGAVPVNVTVVQAANLPSILNVTVLPEGLFNGTGLNKARNESGFQYGTDIADQISIELHSAVAPYSMEGTAFIANLDTLGVASVAIPGSFNGSYYVVVKHRNSLETWSAAPFAIGPGTVDLDFANAAAGVYGGNLKLVSGKYVIFAGDVNHDGTIDELDAGIIYNETAIFGTGYLPADLNGDGVMDALDLILHDNNSSGFVSVRKP
jgi:hypothetical protein